MFQTDTVIGVTNLERWKVSVGKVCKVINRTWDDNGEGWYELEDLETGEAFYSPDIYWKYSE